MQITSRIYLTVMLIITALTTASVPLLADTKQQNAADIYMKAFELYEPIDRIDMFAHGYYEPNEVLTEHLKANSEVIEMFLKASDMSMCQWPNTKPQDLGDLINSTLHFDSRYIRYLIQAEARYLLHENKPAEAINRCIALLKFSRQLYIKDQMSLLISRAVQERTCTLIRDALPLISKDIDLIKMIRVQLTNEYLNEFRLAETIKHQDSNFNRIIDSRKFDGFTFDPPFTLKLSNEFFEKVKAENSKNTSYLCETFKLPYVKAFKELEKAEDSHMDQMEKFFENHPDPDSITAKEFEETGVLFFVGLAVTAPSYLYNFETGVLTHINALKIALDLALVRAETGKLPAALPKNSPKDLFSSDSFVYEQTEKGFKLHCRDKRIKTDKPHYWEFKVKQ